MFFSRSLSFTVLNLSSLSFSPLHSPPPYHALSLNLTPVMSVYMKETREKFFMSNIISLFPQIMHN
jgi:hypothetical protein